MIVAGYTNGCSIPFGLKYFYKKTFTASCVAHDICYACVSVHYSINKGVEIHSSLKISIDHFQRRQPFSQYNKLETTMIDYVWVGTTLCLRLVVVKSTDYILNTYLWWQKIQAFGCAVINHWLYLIQWILQGKMNLKSNKKHHQNSTRNISDKDWSWIFICITCLLQAVKFGISRSTCDSRFKANMQNDCSKLSFFKRQGCKVSAIIHCD